jgi:hypothetical protein
VKTKLLLTVAFLLIAVVILCARTLVPATPSGQKDRSAAQNKQNHPPELGLVNDLDKVIQLRFLNAPQLGMRRIGPNPNPHLEHFEPRTEEEKQAVANLQNDEWKVGIFLIGRRAYANPTIDVNDEKHLLVQYMLNPPVPVTTNVKKSELAAPKSLQDGVDEAFERFNTADTYDFSLGKWAYVARPVRARELCMKCHQDMFVTSKLANKKYTYRSRRIGDTIGVLLYAFDKQD